MVKFHIKNILLLLLFLSLNGIATLCAQVRVEGLVSDRQTKQRVSNVRITNLRTGDVVYNNTKGEFSLEGKQGDQFVTKAQGYFADTVKISTTPIMIIQLQRESIYLQEV